MKILTFDFIAKRSVCVEQGRLRMSSNKVNVEWPGREFYAHFTTDPKLEARKTDLLCLNLVRCPSGDCVWVCTTSGQSFACWCCLIMEFAEHHRGIHESVRGKAEVFPSFH